MAVRQSHGNVLEHRGGRPADVQTREGFFESLDRRRHPRPRRLEVERRRRRSSRSSCPWLAARRSSRIVVVVVCIGSVPLVVSSAAFLFVFCGSWFVVVHIFEQGEVSNEKHEKLLIPPLSKKNNSLFAFAANPRKSKGEEKTEEAVLVDGDAVAAAVAGTVANDREEQEVVVVAVAASADSAALTIAENGSSNWHRGARASRIPPLLPGRCRRAEARAKAISIRFLSYFFSRRGERGAIGRLRGCFA